MRHLVLVRKINVTLFILHGSMPRNIIVRLRVGKYCPFRRPKLFSFDAEMSVTRLHLSREVFAVICLWFSLVRSVCIMSIRPRVSVPKKAFMVYCRLCSLRIVGRTYLIFICAGPRLRKFKWKFYRFSESRYSCITSDWGTDTLFISWVCTTIWNIFVGILHI